MKIMNIFQTGYLLDVYLYLGKDSGGKGLSAEYQRLNKPTQAIMRLITSIEGMHRDLIMDNLFTSVMSCVKIKQLTLVNTSKKNKRQTPSQFLPSHVYKYPSAT